MSEEGSSHLGPGRSRDGLHVEPLSTEVLHAREDDERRTRSLALDHIQDVASAERPFSLAREDFDEGRCGVERVELDLGPERVLFSGRESASRKAGERRWRGYLVARERLALKEDLVSRRRGLVERAEQVVQVRRERTHARDLDLLCTCSS